MENIYSKPMLTHVMKMPYHGGIYKGGVTSRCVKRRKRLGERGRANNRWVPNGWGELIFPGDVKYIGHFKHGLEHVDGTLFWSTGERFKCYFNRGRPEARAMRYVYEAKILKKKLKSLELAK